jgi:hypothetical protein
MGFLAGGMISFVRFRKLPYVRHGFAHLNGCSTLQESSADIGHLPVRRLS